MNGNVEPRGSREATLAPSLAVVVSTVFWGTLWIPLRHLDAAGLGASWATAGGLSLPVVVLLPFAAVRWRVIVASGRPLALTSVLMAACIALYAEALLRGHVARVILLFYLTPVWSTLLARAFLGDRITVARMLTIALGLVGMFVVFGIGTGVPLPCSSAEWMGLLSGLLWASSLVALRRLGVAASEFDNVFVQLLFLAPLFVLCTLVPGGRPWTPATAEIFVRGGAWLVAFGLVWMPLVLWLTMFGGSRLDPGRVAVLLMLEVVIGLASAALLTDEPFGPREVVGAVFIVTACGAEFFNAPCIGAARRAASSAVERA